MSTKLPIPSVKEKPPVNIQAVSQNENLEVFQHDDEKKLVRKIDWRLMPPLMILFTLAFVDRINIGNAKIQGMTKDLHMVGNDYGVALSLFFVPYILFEIPSNLLLKRLSPSTWLSTIMILWGICTIAQGLVHTYGQLLAMRLLIGLFEAGFSPGCVYLISCYYPRYELQWRVSLFFTASIIAGAFGGLFAYALSHMDGVGGYAGWRWIFIIEGLLTVVVAAVSKFVIVDFPETATFLTAHEKALLRKRVAQDGGEIGRMDVLDRVAVARIFRDWKIYLCGLMYFGVVNTGYATSFFTPTIIQEMGFTAVASQVRSIPIFIVASVAAMSVAYMTDRLRHRYAFCMAGVVIGSIGYILLLCQANLSVGVRYMACFFITTGGYVTQPVVWVWLQNNIAGHYKRAFAVAMQISMGNAGGLVASNVFFTNESPRYPTGYGTSLGLLLFCGLACTVFFFSLKKENKIRNAGGRDARFEDSTLPNMGDDHPEFRFST